MEPKCHDFKFFLFDFWKEWGLMKKEMYVTYFYFMSTDPHISAGIWYKPLSKTGSRVQIFLIIGELEQI